jgi:cobalt-zinc-cadmium efflux system outer membrane protein
MPHVVHAGAVAAGLVAFSSLGQPLTLEQALARAREAAPQVQVAARVVQEAEASRVGAGVFLPVNPRLFADYRPLAVELPGQPVDPRHGYNLGVDGQVEVSGASGARLEEAERRVALARAELAFEQALAAARAWVAFAEVHLAGRRVEQLAATLALQERVEHASKERVSAGVAGEPDVTTVAVEVASVRAQLLEAGRREGAARLELAQVLDVGPEVTATLGPLPDAPPEAPDEAALVDAALSRRPELASLRARLALLEATRERLGREGFPKLGYNLGLDAAPASPVFAFVGLSVELPVAQRNQGPRAVAAAQLETERARLETELRRVEREVALARRNYESRRAQVQVLEGEALPQARRTVELIEAGWRAGRLDIFRLTTATRELQRVERERLEALLAAWTDYVELQRVSGGLNR